MTDDTKFPKMWLKPYTMLEKGDYVTRFIQTGDSEKVADWFKRCMEDSPIHKTKYGLWEDWAGKWFSQFREEPEVSKTAIPITVTHYRCPHCEAVDSMLVQKLEDKKGVCIKCFKEMKMEEDST